MNDSVVVALGILGIIVVCKSITFIVKRHRHGELPAVFGLGAALVVGVLYEGGYLPDGRTAQLGLLALPVIATIFSLVAEFRSSKSGALAGWLWLFFIPAVLALVMVIVNVLEGPAETEGDAISRVSVIILWFCVAHLVRSCRLGRASARSVASLAPGSVCSLLVVVGEPWRACDIFKCGPLGELLVGPFVSENYLAEIACVVIIMNLMQRNVSDHKLELLLAVAVVVATGSRTAEVSAIVAIFASFAIGFVTGQRLKSLIGAVVVAAVVATGVSVLFGSNGKAFSNRGEIWRLGLIALDGRWLFGAGLDNWSYYQSMGLLPPLFPHSLYLLVIFGGGLTALAILSLLLVSCAWTLGRYAPADQFRLPFAFLCFVSITGITEVVWNPVTVDGHMFVVMLLLFLVAEGLRGDGSSPNVIGGIAGLPGAIRSARQIDVKSELLPGGDGPHAGFGAKW